MAAPLEREFVADDAAPTAARTYVTAALVGLLPTTLPPTLRDDIELIVSELVTNAVRAASPTVKIVVSYERQRLVLRVEDEGGGWPQPRDAGIHDTNGRGLALVSALCTSWGVTLNAPGRKIVWAEIEIPA